jgi:ribosomal protein S18 acetylase RimI-like enzyme
LIRFIEELSFNAWPALQTLHYDGWLLRFAGGYTRRANSINPIYASTLPDSEKIRHCEQLYAAQGLDTVFKMTEAVQPANLDAHLQDKGYAREAETSVQTLSLLPLQNRELPLDETKTISIKTELTEDWLDTFSKLANRETRYLPLMSQMLHNLLPTACFASVQEGSQAVAVGLGVLERGHLGLYDIVTAAPYRKRGIGTRLIGSLLAWGQANGATNAYLQVMNDNTPALRLYAKFGFREIYQYWYRVKPRL